MSSSFPRIWLSPFSKNAPHLWRLAILIAFLQSLPYSVFHLFHQRLSSHWHVCVRLRAFACARIVFGGKFQPLIKKDPLFLHYNRPPSWFVWWRTGARVSGALLNWWRHLVVPKMKLYSSSTTPSCQPSVFSRSLFQYFTSYDKHPEVKLSFFRPRHPEVGIMIILLNLQRCEDFFLFCARISKRKKIRWRNMKLKILLNYS